MDLRTLREKTEQQHNSVEGMLPVTEPGLDLPRYGQILQCLHGVVDTWETWAITHAPPRLASLVMERRRSPLLLLDLGHFGLPALPGRDGAGEPHPLQAVLAGKDRGSGGYEAAFLGAMYVMEGSTLGGQYIARHVEDVLGLTPGQGDAYFRGYGERTGAMWKAFREVLAAVPDEHAATVIAAARATFAYVEDRLRCCPAALGLATAVS